MSTAGGAHYCPQVGRNCGTVFKVTYAGVLSVLHEFGASSSDGVQPIAPLMQANDGNFYGTTTFGGAQDAGAIFKMTPAGELTILYSFTPTVGGLPPPIVAAAEGTRAAFGINRALTREDFTNRLHG